MTPEVMLFDEATSALDPELVKGVLAMTTHRRLGEQGRLAAGITDGWSGTWGP